MNWLLIIIALILAGYMIRGYQKGLLRVLFSLVSWVITIAFVAWATPYITDTLKEKTDVYQMIEQKCEESVRQRMQEQIAQDSEQKQETLVEYGLVLPEHIQEKLVGKIQKGADYTLEKSGVYQEMATDMADFITKGLSFFVALIFCAILIHFLRGILDVVSRIPILKGVNRILGLIAGGLQGLLAVWLFFYLLTIFQTTGIGQICMPMIYQSEFLTELYENNLLLYVITVYF